jgi:hypothetical protein
LVHVNLEQESHMSDTLPKHYILSLRTSTLIIADKFFLQKINLVPHLRFKFLFHGRNYDPLLAQCLHCPISPPAFPLNLTFTCLILRPLSCLSLTCTASLHSKFFISFTFSFAYVVLSDLSKS